MFRSLFFFESFRWVRLWGGFKFVGSGFVFCKRLNVEGSFVLIFFIGKRVFVFFVLLGLMLDFLFKGGEGIGGEEERG